MNIAAEQGSVDVSRYYRILLVVGLLGAGTAARPARAEAVHAISLSVAHLRVIPDQKQIVSIHSTPRARLYLTATFPSGDEIRRTVRLGRTGRGRWSFIQPKNTITHASRTATVTAAYVADPTQSASSLYTIGYDAVDVAGEVTVDADGAHLDIWAHRGKGAIIRATSSPNCGLTPDSAVADQSGWARFGCTVSTPPASTIYRVTATTPVEGRQVTATTALSMPEAAYDSLVIDGLQLLVPQGNTWQPANRIPSNRMVRLAVLYHATEGAGNWYPPCASGTITVQTGTQVLWSGALICGLTLPSPDGRPYVYLDAYFTDPADLGAVDVQVALQYYPRGDTKTFQETIAGSGASP